MKILDAIFVFAFHFHFSNRQKIVFEKEKKMNDSELEEYIQELRIYPLMQQLLQELIIHRPNEPLEFLVKCIKNLSGT